MEERPQNNKQERKKKEKDAGQKLAVEPFVTMCTRHMLHMLGTVSLEIVTQCGATPEDGINPI